MKCIRRWIESRRTEQRTKAFRQHREKHLDMRRRVIAEIESRSIPVVGRWYAMRNVFSWIVWRKSDRTGRPVMFQEFALYFRAAEHCQFCHRLEIAKERHGKEVMSCN